jgi:hypothetical protein
MIGEFARVREKTSELPTANFGLEYFLKVKPQFCGIFRRCSIDHAA